MIHHKKAFCHVLHYDYAQLTKYYVHCRVLYFSTLSIHVLYEPLFVFPRFSLVFLDVLQRLLQLCHIFMGIKIDVKASCRSGGFHQYMGIKDSWVDMAQHLGLLHTMSRVMNASTALECATLGNQAWNWYKEHAGTQMSATSCLALVIGFWRNQYNALLYKKLGVMDSTVLHNFTVSNFNY